MFTAQLASLPAKEMEERENCRRREALCLFSLVLGRSGPFPGRAAMLSSFYWTAGPWGGWRLSDAEHERHVVGSAKYACVYMG